MRIGTDPDFAQDMRTLYAQINSQLEWRPASPLVLGTTAGGAALAVIFLALTIPVALGGQYVPPGVYVACFYLAVVAILIAGLAAAMLSLAREHWGWLIGASLCIAACVVVLAFTYDALGSTLVLLVVALALLAYGLWGPRRETAGMAKQDRPALDYAPVAARNTSGQ